MAVASEWFMGLGRRALRTDAMVSLAIVMAVVAAWCFLEVADEVAEGSAQRLDDWVVRSVRPSVAADPGGPAWLREVMRDLTALGGVTLLVLVAGVTAGYLLIRRAYHAIWLVLSASLGGLLLSVLLKGYFRRPRPDLVSHLADARLSSFPSGHAMNSAIVYLALGFLLAELSTSARLKAYVLSVAAALTLLVGLSRVYLGVHYPSDVIAGWAVGAAWAALCWLVARRLRRAGSVDSVE